MGRLKDHKIGFNTNIVISDMEINKILQILYDKQGLTKDEYLFQFLAPESLGHGVFNAKTDIYMFGVLIYQIVFNELPYNLNKYNSINELKSQIILKSMTPKINNKSNSDIKLDKLIHLCNRCWDKNERNRPDINTILDVLKELTIQI